MYTDKEHLNRILVTDCGSTTTKALLFEKTAEGWRQTLRGEAPTTVEEPVANVTVGAMNAFREVEELGGISLLEGSDAKHPFRIREKGGKNGIDLYLSTSSAGGGLQMLVAGLVKHMTTESANRAALGAGAIVMDAISADDGREDFERIERIRHLRPDIVLLCGGIDGGNRHFVVELAELLAAAAPRPRFGDTLKLPVIFAGNKDAEAEVRKLLVQAEIIAVENVRPVLERENLHPAREAIHEFFLHSVMSHAPGYATLLGWTPVPIMPTPAAVGNIVETYAQETGQQVLCADIGGATTDVFSVFRDKSGTPKFNRTVSANYGMSYSMANVLVEAGAQNIMRWLPFILTESEVRDRIRNKMIRPTTIPQTREDLWLEQAICREALRLSLTHHRSLAVGLSGSQQQRTIADVFSQKKNRYELVDMNNLDLVIGSGGVLSHAPQRLEAALMMLDGFELQGLTHIAVDSIFMMPHLGVLASVHPEASREIFERDCLVSICHAIAPTYRRQRRAGEPLARISWNGAPLDEIKSGMVQRHKLPVDQKGQLEIVPAFRDVDVGTGAGEVKRSEIYVGPYGLLSDGRNRPIRLSKVQTESAAAQAEIYKAVGIW